MGVSKCRTGKRRYHAEDEAKLALSRIKARSTREDVPDRYYHCVSCGGWHLTRETVRPLLARHTRLKAVSDARRDEDPEYEAAKATVFLRDRGRCQAEGMAGVPHGGRKDPHHVLPLGRQGPRCEPANMIVMCRAAHDWAHTHPIEAVDYGLLLHSGATLADMEAASDLRQLWRNRVQPA